MLDFFWVCSSLMVLLGIMFWRSTVTSASNSSDKQSGDSCSFLDTSVLQRDLASQGWVTAHQPGPMEKAIALFMQREGLEERVWRILKLLKLLHLASREVRFVPSVNFQFLELHALA